MYKDKFFKELIMDNFAGGGMRAIRDDVKLILSNYLYADKLLYLNNQKLAQKLSNPCLSIEKALTCFDATECIRVKICKGRNDLSQFMNNLSAKERFIILGYIQGLQASDMSEILKMTERSVFRLLASVKGKLERFCDNGGDSSGSLDNNE